MAIPIKTQIRFWAMVAVVFIALVWLLQDVLVPFVAGFAIAYLLDPVVNKLAKGRMPRWAAVLCVLATFLVVFVSLIMVAAPLITQQVGALLSAIPEFARNVQEHLGPRIAEIAAQFSNEDVGRLRELASQYAGAVLSWLGGLIQGIVTSGAALANILGLFVITPIVAFYMMRDWPRITGAIDNLLPKEHAPVIRRLFGEIDGTMAGFIRGQLSVCFILGTFYAITLSLAGLNFGFVIGLTSGLLSFIPYIGSGFGLIASVGVAAFQFQDPTMVGIIAAIFLGGQLVEGNFLTPRLVGGSVGLHDVWVIFALMVGGSLFGFTGLLLAVPVAAIIGVLIRFAISQYRQSGLYRGTEWGGENNDQVGGVSEALSEPFSEFEADDVADELEEVAGIDVDPTAPEPGKA